MKRTWEGKSRGTVLGYKVFIFILRYVGIRTAYFVLRFVALYYFFFAPKAFRAAWFYFREVWKYSFFKSLYSVYKSFYCFGQTLLDKVIILSNIPNNFTYNFDGSEHLKKAAQDKTGAILISAHAGNWEAASFFLEKFKVPVKAVLFDAELAHIKKVLSKVATSRYQPIAIREDFSHLIQIHKALKNKDFLCIHGDRFLEQQRHKTIPINFLGKKALFPSGPFELTARFKMPYIFVFAFKASNTHYHFFAFANKNETWKATNILQEYVTALEKVICQYPTQWFNYYNFWEK